MNAVMLIEAINIWNLVQLSTILDLIMNYIALGVISEFDDVFLEPYK
jgi:hypothetical protein